MSAGGPPGQKQQTGFHVTVLLNRSILTNQEPSGKHRHSLTPDPVRSKVAAKWVSIR
jgi:hypothetical protein